MVQVFVSSTWLDLQSERAAVAAVLQRLRETKFLGMESFGSRDESTQRASLDEVDRSQVYLGLFAGRYGSGITEDEYRRARQRDMPCFIYFKVEPAIPAQWRETDPALAAKLATLKQNLRRHHTVTEFRTPEDLAARVATDLHRWLVEEFLEPKLAQATRGEVPRAETERLLAAIQDLSALNQPLLARLRSKGFVIAQGERSVAAERITDSVIVTGDRNTVVQNRGSVFLAAPGADPVQALIAYRRTLVTSYRQLSLRGMDIGASDPTSGQKQLELDQIYVGLDTTELLGEEKPVDAQGRPFRRQPTTMEKRQLTALEGVAHSRHTVILGDPGSGKSTFLNHLALCLASHALEPDADWLGHLPGWPGDQGNLLPIPVVLRDYVRSFSEKPGPAEARHLWNFIVQRLRAQNLEAAEAPLRQALEDGQAIVLLDGLDEIPTAGQRGLVRDAVVAFAGRYNKSRFIVTCRTLSYQDGAWQLPGFRAFTLAPFNEEKINRFIAAWYADLARLRVLKTDDAPHLAASLQAAVRRPDLWRLAPNPLLLIVMALVHTHKGRLPDARALLYEDMVDILLWRWEQMKASRDAETPGLRQLLNQAGLSDVDLKRALWRLAFETHRLGGAKKKRDEPHQDALADLEEADLHDALAQLHPCNQECRAWVGQVIETIKLRAGLLIERVAHIFTFPHRTFQEYLAGAHLASLPDFATKAAQLAAEGPLWREVILLAVGRLVYLGGDIFKPLALVAELCPENAVNSELGWQQAWMAGEVTLEAGLQRVRGFALGRDLLARVQGRLAKLLEAGALTPVERAAAGVALGKLGDQRPGVGLKNGLPEIDWIEIPQGSFVMGSEKDLPGWPYKETPQFRCQLIQQPYCISRYPVTVAQYQAFVDAGGYGDKAKGYWTKAGWAWKQSSQITGPEDDDPVYQTPNHPRIGVSWYEAIAFCRWLSKLLKMEVTLPSEAQWERAARHNDGRLYPWGNADQDVAQRCNMTETGIGRTSVVGLFLNGLAECRAADMAGNVWEWCRTKWREDYRDYEKKADDGLDGDAARVLRGGAFFYSSDDVRCDCRLRGGPDFQSWDVGFRVVASPFVPGR